MDTNNWRPAPGGGVSGEPMKDGGDWRSQLQPDSRKRIVNKIMDTLKRHLPFSGQEGLQELNKIAVRFEEKIYTSATSQPDYLRKISLKMLTMETNSQNTLTNSLPSNSGSNSKNPPDTGSLGMQSQIANQGQSLPIPMAANQAQARQQLSSQNIQKKMASTGVQGSANLASALPTAGGLPQPTTMPNVVGQNSNLQNIQNISAISQNSVGNSMGQGVSSNVFANMQRQMPGRQQVVPQQQQSQHPQQQCLYQQQQQLMKQKYQQGSITNTQMQSHLQQQQAQYQQNQILPQSTQLQSSQQFVMQHSGMQPAPVSGLQQNQQSSVQQSTQPMLQQNSQAVLRQQQQQQQPSIIHQQQTPMQQQPMLPSQQQQQQQVIGQQSSSTLVQQNQIVGQQNSIPDMQQQHRLLNQQNSLANLQQQQLMSQQNNLPNIHQQQHLGAQSNIGAIQQRQQQQLLVNQSGNSSMQTTQHSVPMLQQSKLPLQQQNHQSAAILLPNQGQQSEPQQKLLSQIQSQPGQLQQQCLQQPNSLPRDMQQMLQTSGPVLQSQNVIDQQKQLFQSPRAIPEASSTSLDSTAQTGNTNSGDWQEDIYHKIKGMRGAYLPELTEIYQKIAGKLQQHDSLPQQPKNDQLEKLKIFKTMLERILQFLQTSKTNISPNLKVKVGAYEKQIIKFLNSNRPRKPGTSLQQGQQIPPQHIQSMQQSQQSQHIILLLE